MIEIKIEICISHHFGGVMRVGTLIESLAISQIMNFVFWHLEKTSDFR